MTATTFPAKTRRPALLLASSVCAVGLLLGGCVATDEYEGAAEAARASDARVIALSQENASLRDALNSRNASDEELRAQNARLRQERATLSDDISDLRERILSANTAISAVSLGSGLDPATDRALRALASRYDVMTYDPATGRISFASDLTFPSGSDTVRDAAKSTLADFARILNTSDGGNYLIYIEGHTDSQVPSNPNTVKNHPTNRHLSAHRAISVGNTLRTQGISDARIFTGGWGASRPVVANAKNGNTPANRRVEIYLIADRGGAVSSGNAPATNDTPAPSNAAPARDAPMK